MDAYNVKQNNQDRIYFYLREKAKATKQQIAYDLDLSLPTVSHNLESLVQEGAISSQSKMVTTMKGRKPVIYSYVSNAKVSIGIDITKNHIKCAIVDLNGNICYYRMQQTPFMRNDEYMKLLGAFANECLEESQTDAQRVLGIGIGLPGLVSPDGKEIIHGRVIDNDGLRLETLLTYLPDFPAFMIHDSSAAAAAESWVSPEIDSAYYLLLSNSIGASVTINHEIYMGNPFYSSEVGHMKIFPNGKQCYCGQYGCAEMYCCASLLSNKTNNDLTLFFEKLSQGDQAVNTVWQEYTDNLALVINNIRMLYGSPIIIGGYIGIFIDNYIHELRAKVDATNTFEEKSSQYLFPSKMKIESIAVGSALFFIKEYLHSSRNN